MENELVIAQLMRGERPDGMSYQDFKIKRKAVQVYIKRKLKGSLINKPQEEIVTKLGKDDEVLETKIVNKPYKKKES